MGNFGNYDIGLWPEDQRVSSIAERLVDLFPSVEDQKYLVTYSTWEPGAGSRTVHLIYKGSEYVEVE